MVWFAATVLGTALTAAPLLPAVEVQEPVYAPAPANNGAGPLWCYGSTCLVRRGDDVFISGLETLADQKPLNNVRWVLYRRTPQGWTIAQADPTGRQREPCPLVVTDDGRLLLSTNPTLTPPGTYNGAAQPKLLQFRCDQPQQPPTELLPVFKDPPPFSEHSYRGFAGDGRTGEALLFNIWMYDRYHWAFFDAGGKCTAAGKLEFPFGAEYEKPEPIRCCYPEILVRGREVHVLAISDIIEPVRAWREYKEKLTGQKWDYDFRRLFYTWTPDITKEPFRPWVEVASREKTCGHISNLDLWLDAQGRAHLLWIEQSVWHLKMRDQFFPGLKQTWSLHYGIAEQGQLKHNTVLLEGGEGIKGPVPGYARFQATPDARLFACYYAYGADADGKPVNENRLVELLPDGTAGPAARVPFELPFSSFMTATVRGGSKPSYTLDLYGTVSGGEGLWYGRVDLANRLLADFNSTVARTADGSRLTLDAGASRSLDGPIADWRWTIEGRAATGRQTELTIDHGGAVPVTLTVRDGAGHERTAKRTVHLPLAPRDLGLKQWGLALRCEAESFAAEGGGAIHVRHDKLHASGMSLSHWNSKGHWLEWIVDVPQSDTYHLVLRYATPENARRALDVDGQAWRVLVLPRTGGYGSENADNWSLAAARRDGGLPVSLELTAGPHTLRLTNPDGTGCNLDYLELVAAKAPYAEAPQWLGQADGPYRYLVPLSGTLAPTRIRAEIASCYTVPIGRPYLGDGVKDVPASKLRLFEDGQELGPAHAAHADIRAQGRGRFSHWVDWIYFSASDNSDPRRNGRKYTWRIDR